MQLANTMRPFANYLKLKLRGYLKLKRKLYVANVTVALQIAIKAPKLKGEIITTPFSFVATTSSVVWEDCKPVLVDVNPKTSDIDAARIESAITGKTTAIAIAQLTRTPWDIEMIESIAKIPAYSNV